MDTTTVAPGSAPPARTEEPVIRRTGMRHMLSKSVSQRARVEKIIPKVKNVTRYRSNVERMKRKNRVFRQRLKRYHDSLDSAARKVLLAGNEIKASVEECHRILKEHKKRPPPGALSSLNTALNNLRALDSGLKTLYLRNQRLLEKSDARVESDTQLDAMQDNIDKVTRTASQLNKITAEVADIGKSWARIGCENQNRYYVEAPRIPGYITFSPFTVHDPLYDRDDVNVAARENGVPTEAGALGS